MDNISIIERIAPNPEIAAVLTVGLMFLLIYVTFVHGPKWKLIKIMGPPVPLVGAAIFLSNTGIAPAPGYEVYNSIYSTLMPVALALLLLSVNFRTLKKSMGSKPFLIMAIGGFATMLGGLIIGFVFKPNIIDCKGYAAQVAAGIGGTENFLAVAQALQLGEEFSGGFSIAMVLSVSLITTINYCICGNKTLSKKFNAWIKPTFDVVENLEEMEMRAKEHIYDHKWSSTSVALAIILSCSCVGFSYSIGKYIPRIPLPGGGIITIESILVMTTVCLLIGAIFPKLTNIEGMAEIGQVCLWLVLVALYMRMDFSDLKNVLYILLPYCLIYILHWIIIIIAAKFMKIDIITTLIASTANIGGGNSAPICAMMTGHGQLVPMAVTMAALGYAMANYGGWLVGQILLKTLHGITI